MWMRRRQGTAVAVAVAVPRYIIVLCRRLAAKERSGPWGQFACTFLYVLAPRLIISVVSPSLSIYNGTHVSTSASTRVELDGFDCLGTWLGWLGRTAAVNTCQSHCSVGVWGRCIAEGTAILPKDKSPGPRCQLRAASSPFAHCTRLVLGLHFFSPSSLPAVQPSGLARTYSSPVREPPAHQRPAPRALPFLAASRLPSLTMASWQQTRH
jgi:hypothetical protein